MHHKIRWTAEKIAQRLQLVESLVYRQSQPIPDMHYTTLPGPMADPLLGDEESAASWQVIAPNTYWGQRFTNFMMRSQFQVPQSWGQLHPVAIFLPLGEAGDFSHPEALAYIDGEAYAACDRHHQEILLPARWQDRQTHSLNLHGWTGLLGFRLDQPDPRLYMGQCALVQIDQATRDFVATARIAIGMAESLDEQSPAQGHLLNALDDAFKLVELREPFGEAFYQSIPAAHAALQAGIEKAGPPMDVSIVGSGHAHIDVAWLWTLGETRRKAGRTFHTVLRLMEQFPEYHFTQSQPQLYDYIQQDYPGLLDAIKERVAQGRWEVIGGMWVEADCNLSGSESLARQFLLGRSYFKEHFGDAESPVLWLPDVFGYAWNLPQLIKEAGLEYFFTIKIGWSQYNRLPFDSFWWQGLDGTKVLTHFSTTPEGGSAYASTYNAFPTPQSAMGTWTNFQQKELQQELLMAFGYGDGGGGPTREMLENIREMGAFPAAPQMRQGPVGQFFADLEANSGDMLPTWNGELYLELHRGTYTTQGRNKRANRKSEFLLHDAEFLAALASQLDPAFVYPTGTLNKAWELICLNQFHDIIPGSSVGPVYVESLAQYEQIRQMGEEVRDRALAAIARDTGGDILVINPTGFSRSDLALWPDDLSPGQCLSSADGTPVLSQPTAGGTLIAADGLPAYSVTNLTISDSPAPEVHGVSVSATHLENAFVRVTLDNTGNIIGLYDKANQREVLPAGTVAGQLQAFEDRPMNWDAWDVDIFYDDKMWLSEAATRVSVVESGPLRGTVEIKRRILHSEYSQRISLAYNSARIDFDTTIDWQERHILLKVAFPTTVMSPTATYEIQWGNTERPTHRNTSWDWARFETCAQKWVDLSEGNYGVSLLNDCKYGHDIRDNVMRISLLRGPTLPDPTADLGEHRFAYSLLPHGGRWSSQTIAAAYALNDPLLVTSGAGSNGAASSASTGSLIAADKENVVIETVKQAQDGDGLIVRLYESQRMRGPLNLTCNFPIGAAWRTNLLEENQSELECSQQGISYQLRPFEIATIRILPA